jgi:hypothetical protein
MKQILIWSFAIIVAIILWPIVLVLLAFSIDIIIISLIAIWIVAICKS